MDDVLKEKVDRLMKSMYKRIKQVSEKDAINDLLDSDYYAEMGEDSIPKGKTGILNKDQKYPSKKNLEYPSKEDIKRAKNHKIPDVNQSKSPEKHKKDRRKDDLRHPTDVKDPKYPSKRELEYPKVKKTEEIVKSVMDGFQKISKAYLMEKAKIDKVKHPEGSKKAASKRKADRAERKLENPSHEPHSPKKKWYKPTGGSSSDELSDGSKRSKEQRKEHIKKLKEKRGKEPSKEDLEYPMASSEKGV